MSSTWPVLSLGHELMLVDETPEHSSGNFDDLQQRLFVHYHTETTGATREVHVTSDSFDPRSFVRFSTNLGYIRIGSGPKVDIEDFLYIDPSSESTLDRNFVASDGKEYRWRWESNTNRPDWEWECTESDGTYVASYEKPVPPYASDYVLVFVEHRSPIALEIVATFMIMRRIKKHYKPQNETE